MRSLLLFLSLFTPVIASAGVIVNVVEDGNDVFWAGSGTLDISALSQDGTFPFWPEFSNPQAFFLVGAPQDGDTYSATDATFDGPLSIGPSSDRADAGMFDLLGVDFDHQAIAVPTGYVSGDALTVEARYNNTTIAALGLTPGSYVWAWDTAGGGREFISLVIAPEPSTALLLAGGLVLLSARRRQLDLARPTSSSRRPWAPTSAYDGAQ